MLLRHLTQPAVPRAAARAVTALGTPGAVAPGRCHPGCAHTQTPNLLRDKHCCPPDPAVARAGVSWGYPCSGCPWGVPGCSVAPQDTQQGTGTSLRAAAGPALESGIRASPKPCARQDNTLQESCYFGWASLLGVCSLGQAPALPEVTFYCM